MWASVLCYWTTAFIGKYYICVGVCVCTRWTFYPNNAIDTFFEMCQLHTNRSRYVLHMPNLHLSLAGWQAGMAAVMYAIQLLQHSTLIRMPIRISVLMAAHFICAMHSKCVYCGTAGVSTAFPGCHYAPDRRMEFDARLSYILSNGEMMQNLRRLAELLVGPESIYAHRLLTVASERSVC